ncbi:class I SAM-dependent methyltransferase [Maricaulis maris]|uniref:class I SAM-dependent methyltransferase n=1 Tax=Maricaulis maris TaxID=74318 RepID=UPI003B8EA0BC
MQYSSAHHVSARAWADFWNDEGSAAHVVKSEQDAAALHTVWQGFLAPLIARGSPLRFLDLACGDAVVARQGATMADAAGVALAPICCDYSEAAVRIAREGMPGAAGLPLAANAARLPIADSSIDVVVSQYGAEYAGPDAFSEMARVLAPGGDVQAVVHQTGGVVHLQCSDAVSVLSNVLDQRLLRRFAKLLKLLHKTAGATQLPAGVKQARIRFDAAFQTVQAAVESAGPGAARDHVVQLCRDLNRSLTNWQAYRLADLERWAVVQESAVEGFRLRMRTMTEAAVDRAGADGLAARLAAAGLDRVEVGEFAPAHHTRPAGWIVRASRPA